MFIILIFAPMVFYFFKQERKSVAFKMPGLKHVKLELKIH